MEAGVLSLGGHQTADQLGTDEQIMPNWWMPISTHLYWYCTLMSSQRRVEMSVKREGPRLPCLPILFTPPLLFCCALISSTAASVNVDPHMVFCGDLHAVCVI